jgi:hypothetical protein
VKSHCVWVGDTSVIAPGQRAIIVSGWVTWNVYVANASGRASHGPN